MRAASIRSVGTFCKPGNVDDHHVADLLPAHQDDEAPEAVGGVQREQRLAQGRKARR